MFPNTTVKKFYSVKVQCKGEITMKIATVNINRWRESHKRNKIWEILKIYNFDLKLLQETHINSKSMASQIEKE